MSSASDTQPAKRARAATEDTEPAATDDVQVAIIKDDDVPAPRIVSAYYCTYCHRTRGVDDFNPASLAHNHHWCSDCTRARCGRTVRDTGAPPPQRKHRKIGEISMEKRLLTRAKLNARRNKRPAPLLTLEDVATILQKNGLRSQLSGKESSISGVTIVPIYMDKPLAYPDNCVLVTAGEACHWAATWNRSVLDMVGDGGEGGGGNGEDAEVVKADEAVQAGTTSESDDDIPEPDKSQWQLLDDAVKALGAVTKSMAK